MRTNYRIFSATAVALAAVFFLTSGFVLAADNCDPTRCEDICKVECKTVDAKECAKLCAEACKKDSCEDGDKCCKADGKACQASCQETGDKCCPTSAVKASANSDCCAKVGNSCSTTKGFTTKKPGVVTGKV